MLNLIILIVNIVIPNIEPAETVRGNLVTVADTGLGKVWIHL